MSQIKPIESSDDKRIGRPGFMPLFDVFGNEVTPPFNRWEPGWNGVFFILPARALDQDETAQLYTMEESLKSAPVPGTPNSSESFPVQDLLNEPTVRPDFASMDVSADDLKLKSEEPSYSQPAPKLPRRGNQP